MPNFTFYRGRKQATTNFVSPSEHDLDMAPRNLAAGLGSPKFDEVSGNNRDKDWKNASSLFTYKRRFRCRRHPWILKVPKKNSVSH